MGGTPLRLEYLRLTVGGTGGGEGPDLGGGGGTRVGSRVNLLRVRALPWTEARRRMEERAAAVGSALRAAALVRLDLSSSGSRQMLLAGKSVSERRADKPCRRPYC